MDDQQPFGDWLREQAVKVGHDPATNVRQKPGWMAAIARASGVSQSQISRAVAGTRTLDVPGYRAIAAALGVPTVEVLLRAGVLAEGDLASPLPLVEPRPVADTVAFARLRGVAPEATSFYVQAVDAITNCLARPT